MKTLKEELIEFLTWYEDTAGMRSYEGSRVVVVNTYIDSINSDAPAESRSVSDNEDKKSNTSHYPYAPGAEDVNPYDLSQVRPRVFRR